MIFICELVSYWFYFVYLHVPLTHHNWVQNYHRKVQEATWPVLIANNTKENRIAQKICKLFDPKGVHKKEKTAGRNEALYNRKLRTSRTDQILWSKIPLRPSNISMDAAHTWLSAPGDSALNSQGYFCHHWEWHSYLIFHDVIFLQSGTSKC